MNHSGKRLFITGIPTSGKSYLTNLLAEKVNGIAVMLDDFREELSSNEQYRKWTNFYIDQDELTYLSTTSPERQWNNLIAQSEGLWPAFLSEIYKYRDDSRPVIFESVNMLPYLVKRDLDFDGVVLIGSSLAETLERNIKDPRWGNTSELQELEARTFFEIERPHYREEALKYGYPTFDRADDAVSYCLRVLE